MDVRRLTTLSVACLVACGMVAALCAADAPAKLELKLAKGDALQFTVTTASSTEGTNAQGAFKQSGATEVKYAIKVEDKKDNGDLVLAVTYASVKIKEEGRQGTFEYDSAKASGSEETANLDKAAKSAVKVTVSGNKVKEVTGFPEIARPTAGKDAKGGAAEKGKRAIPMLGGFFRGMNVVGASALTRDLAYILSSPVQGVALEKGKTYQAAPTERPADDEKGKGRGGAGRMGGANLEYTFEGPEADAAKFAVVRKPPATARGGGAAGAEAKGTALVAMKDGLLQKLELKSASERSSDRGGQTVTTKTSMTTTVVRTTAK